jgi:hypothetical protein
MEEPMTGAIVTLSTFTPPAATIAPGDTPVFAAFRRWAETIHWADRAEFTTEEDNNRRCGHITRREHDLVELTPIDARDMACVAWVALNQAACGGTKSDPCAFDSRRNPAAALFAEAVRATYPDIAAVLAGSTCAQMAQ